MFSLFKKKKENQKIDNVESLVQSIIKQRHYVYSANDLREIEAYNALKKESKSFQKEFIVDALHYLEHVLDKENQIFKKNNDDTYKYRLVTYAIINGLMRRNLDYSEKEWIDMFQSIRDISKNIKNFSLSDFPVNYAVQQIERYIKKRRFVRASFFLH